MKRVLASLRDRRATTASVATLTIAAVTLATLALVSPGVPTADLELDDGGVWVTKGDDLLVGHLNYPSRLLDGAARTTAPDFDVLQSGDRILVQDRAGGALWPIDPATTRFDGNQLLPARSAVALGGETVAVAGAGFLHAVKADELIGARFEEEGSLAPVGADAQVAVSTKGDRVVAASAAERALTVVDVASGEARTEQLSGYEPLDGATLQVAAVGDRGVAFDPATGTLFIDGGTRVEIPNGAGAQLQQSSAASDAVYLSTRTGLVRQSLGGGESRVVAETTSAAPSAPVQLNGCAYAIWGDGQYVRDCADAGQNARVSIQLANGATPVLRTNRRVVVVNDTRTGTVWVVNDQAERVDNWEDVLPKTTQDDREEESEEEQQQYDIPPRSPENHKPVAVDDEYGVRPGRTTLLRVTENDSDPDGDLLAASLLGEAPPGITVTPVLGGAALQVAVAANVTGNASLRYRVEDGRGMDADATVSLMVKGAAENGAPVLEKPRTLRLEAGASLADSALTGWKDPDGDDLVLSGASVEGGDVVTFRPNGVIEFKAASEIVGVKDIVLTVSDGRETTQSVLHVDVRAKGGLSPVANADRIQATAGRPITVHPLANDLNPTGEELRLTRNDPVPGAQIALDASAGTFEFTAANPGVYYVQYLVTAGPRSSIGLVRVDVVPDTSDGRPPVATRDTGLLPTGRSALVDVLANDEDPSGGVLVVQSARVPDNAGVSVEVLDHSILRITDVGGLNAPVTMAYTVSNGVQSAIGEVVVVPVPLADTLRPPVAVDDTATVRAGDVVSVPVIENDYHPDNDVIRLVPKLVETNVADAAVFVDGDRIRMQAGQTAGLAYVTYEIEDSQGNRAAAYVKIQVLPTDAGANSAPRPRPVTARSIAGTSVRIPVPLEGIDPDGDSVELTGIGSNPMLGSVEVTDSWLTYTAHEQSQGRDSFTYTVRDRLGAEASSTVTVGVAQPGVDNQAPTAVKDVVRVRPGRQVAVPVTVNDTDPDGDVIAIDPEGLVVPAGVDAEVVNGRVVVTAPNQPGETTIVYAISDAYGATAQGVLLVTADENAPLLAPVARDDRVPRDAVQGDRVQVDVLANDEDPDGTVDALRVDVFDADASVGAGGLIDVALTPGPQIIRYALTDQDGLTGQAFVFVPGADQLQPTLRAGTEVVVKSGERVELPLADYVIVREGRTPRVAVADSVRTGHADGSPTLPSAETLAYVSASDYFGPDSIGAMITDGTGPDDPEGRQAYVSIPITVRPATNQTPAVRSASVKAGAGEGETTLNLAKLTRDPDEGDLERMAYSIAGAVPAGFSADVSGSTLTVRADANVPSGTSAQLTVQADDGTSEPGTGVVTMTAVASQRPMPVANDDAVADAKAGQAVVVDVLANDLNPFQGEQPLTVVSARVDTAGSHTAVVQGDKVAVTPAADFNGTLFATYRIQDAAKAPEREVEAKIAVTVKGKPAAPGVPTVTSIQDRTVVLSWAPPANNGSPITSYLVRSQNGYTKTCASTTCTLDGLTNDVEYVFQVVAVNAIGESDPSPASAPARPDARPGPPAPPTLVFGNASLQVSWGAPPVTGSPVTSYDLEISPAPDSGPALRTGVTGTSLDWTGLRNGVAYQVKVRGHNKSPEPGDWSGYSATMIPAGPPGAPGVPQVSIASAVGGQAQVAVNWAAADPNGDPVSGYTLLVKNGGSVVQTIPVTGTSQNVSVGTSESDYTFSVTATNKAGESASSGDSAPRRAAGAPDAPTGVTLTAGDQRAALAFTPGGGNGNRPEELTWNYRVNQTGATGTVPAGGGSIGGLTNGTSYTVDVWATSSVQGVSQGASATSTAAIPFGKPIITLQGIDRLDNAVRFRYNVNANGRTLTGQNPQAVDGSGNVSFTAQPLQPNESYTLNASYTNEAGTSTASWTGQANPPPPKQATVSKTGGNSFTLNYQGFPPGTYIVKCWNDDEHANASEREPDFIGTVGQYSFSTSGTMSLSCPRTPPPGKFSVEIQGIYWTPTISW